MNLRSRVRFHRGTVDAHMWQRCLYTQQPRNKPRTGEKGKGEKKGAAMRQSTAASWQAMAEPDWQFRGIISSRHGNLQCGIQSLG